jgi:O-antigen/teichoic acid export membrane protein
MRKINYLSKKVGIDLNYFLKGGVWLSLSQVSNMLKGFLISIFFANFASMELYGTYSLIITFISLAGIFSFYSYKSALIQSIVKKNYGNYKIILKKVLKLSLLGSLFLIITTGYYYYSNQLEIAIVLLCLSFLFPLFNTSSYYKNYLIGLEEFKKNSIFDLIINIGLTVLVFYLLILESKLFTIFITWILFQIIFQLIFLIKFTKIENKGKVDLENIEYGKKLSYTSGLNSIILHFDNIIISFFLGVEKLAIYLILTLLPNQLKVVFTTLTPMIIPKLVKNDFSKKSLFKQVLKVIFVVLLFIITYSLIAEIFFRTFFNQYYEYWKLSVLYSFSLIVLPYIIIEEYFKAKLDNKLNKINNISAVLNLILLLSLIQFGILGAIIAKIVYRIIILLLGIYYFFYN